MNLENVFPRNPDGTLKHKQPCQTPGCNWPCWHPCLKAMPDDGVFERLVRKSRRGKPGQNASVLKGGLTTRWERHREQTRERDRQIIEDYSENQLGFRQLSQKYGIAYQTARNIIHRSGVPVRKRGLNIAYDNSNA